MISFDDLITPKTYADMRAALFALLQNPPSGGAFPVTSWREGDVARTLTEVDAQSLAELSKLIVAIASGGLLEKATGDWLTLLAWNVYGLERGPAVATLGTCRLTAAAGVGPYFISPGQLWAASTTGLRYQSANTSGLTVPLGGTLNLTFRAEEPGAAYNVANGTITSLLTSLPGVSISNPNPGSGSWVTTVGVDVESDELLKIRCRARWAELGFGSPDEAYDLWAKAAATAITRTRPVPDVAGPNGGGVTIYVAGPSGPVTTGDVAAAQTYIAARAPLTVIPTVVNTTANAQTITATLFGKPQYQASALAAATAALQALAASIPIGGTLYRAAVLEALMSPGGVQNATLSAPAADVVLAAGQVLTLTVNLSWSNL